MKIKTFFTTLKAGWKAATLAEKLTMVTDVICGIGSGAIGTGVAKIVNSHSTSKVEKVCVDITCLGLGWAMGETAKNAIVNSAIIPITDMINARKAAETTEEEKADE